MRKSQKNAKKSKNIKKYQKKCKKNQNYKLILLYYYND